MQRSSRSWKLLRMSTKTYALQFLDSASELLLSRTVSDAYDEVQGQLTVMHERFSDMLDKESAPQNKITNYSSLHKLMKSHQGENHYRTVEALETQLAKEERECKRLEEEIEACSLYADGASSIHPILQFKPEDKT